jgi:hypothetical protein
MMTLKEAYKSFYTSEYGKLVLADWMRFAEINKPVYRPGDKVEDAIYMSAIHGFIHYVLEQCDSSLQKEIEENVGNGATSYIEGLDS